MSEDQRAAVMAEIVRRAILKHKEGSEIKLVAIKQAVCAELKYPGRVPKTVEIIAAVPQKYSFLIPILKAKPVRSASGIAVVAVMCKPHRCPHITMTGNICVYCFPEDGVEVATNHGFLNFAKLSQHYNPPTWTLKPESNLLILAYDAPSDSFQYQRSERLVVNNAQPRQLVQFRSQAQHAAITVTEDHDMWVKDEATCKFSKAKAGDISHGVTMLCGSIKSGSLVAPVRVADASHRDDVILSALELGISADSFGDEVHFSADTHCQMDSVQRLAYNGRTWCVTVPSGLIVVRQVEGNQVLRPIVVGNCPGGPDSDFEYSTQSYTGYEPTSMRAIRARYSPFLQTRNRVDQLVRLGHSVDKVEFIIMGGTFMSLPEEYRDYFIRNLHDALSGHSSRTVAEAIAYSEQSESKCIGITIETRPDYCLQVHLSQLLSYGCTRLEIGVQSIYEDIARDTNRGHTVRSVCEAFRTSKDCGYKIVAHMMPDLPNSPWERDMEGFKEFFENPAFRPDGVKIYPTLVIRGTGLYELWRTGRYKNLPPDRLVDLVANILALVPPWTRIYRIQRDIPMPLVTSGVEHGNLRELAMARNVELGLRCRDVRSREVGIKNIHDDVLPQHVELIRRDYAANGGMETFLSYEDPKQDILVGLLRLRKCADATFRPELRHSAGPVSIVRELHVYGTAVPIHTRNPAQWQHQGYGTLLMEEAERIARVEHGSVKLAVIAGVGTRHYYRKLGYSLDGPYMSKMLEPANNMDADDFDCW